MALVLALASCFMGPAGAQPTGAQAVHGTAVLSREGNVLRVTTHNGAGTQHSAINWQTFSIPAGTATHFAQPGTGSTSINRVVGPDPSAIFGTLSSNGRLVLVNPAGIAVGAGAVVDTASFTASTLRMSDADALAGRLRFADGAGGTLRVDGQVLARSGDVVLIGSTVQAGSDAVIRSPQGATILAAGQKVEVTGRGLEGIRFELQSTADQALNLGTLSGDAVGIFAGTLRHSGAIRAQAVSIEGGRVVLQAGDTALASGTIHAQGTGGAGGQVDLLGTRVGLLGGAVVDTSNTASGGQVRIGGDYQGANAAVPNAQATYVASDAVVRASATQQGDGGQVIVWADDAARVHGTIEAQAGPQGGRGGFVETSGKHHLDVNGITVRAAEWLLDPDNIRIANVVGTGDTANTSAQPNFSAAPSGTSTISTATLNSALNGGVDVTVTSTGEIQFDASPFAGGDIQLRRDQAGLRRLTLDAGTGIRFSGGTTSFQVGTDPGAELFVDFRPGVGGVTTEVGATTQFNVAGTGLRSVGRLQGGTTWTNLGTVNLYLRGQLQLHDGTAASTFSNAGTLNLWGGGIDGAGGPGQLGQLDNQLGGTIQVTTGTNSGVLKANVGNLGMITHDGDLQITSLTQSAATAVTSGAGHLKILESLRLTGGVFAPSGSLTVTQKSGDLDLPSGLSINSTGDVSLQSQAGAANFDGSLTAARVSLRAGTAIRVNGNLQSSVGMTALEAQGDIALGTTGSVSIGGKAGVLLRSGANIALGTTANGASLDGMGGLLNIEAAGNITGGDGWATLYGTGIDLVAGGDVRFGSSTVGGASLAGNNGSDVTIRVGPTSSSSDIDGTIYIDTSSTAARAGNIHLQAGGAISVKSLYANGDGSGTAGGFINVQANGDVFVETANASGATHYEGVGGAGGRIAMRSEFGAVSANDLHAYGGYGSNGGGQGGSIGVTAAAGSVTLNGSVLAQGGDTAGGLAGDGGNVSLHAPMGAVRLYDVDVRGGYGIDAGAPGGRGGNVHLLASSAIGESLADSGYYLDAGGGEGGGGTSGAVGGAGGSVLMEVVNGSLDLANGYVQATGGAGGDADTVGGTGGTGGSVVLRGAAGVLSGPGAWIDVSGGKGGESAGLAAADAGGQGGQGGRVSLEGGGRSAWAGGIAAYGGNGGDVLQSGSSAVSGTGGQGGAVTFSFNGSLLLGGMVAAGRGGPGGAATEGPPPETVAKAVTTDAPGATTTSLVSPAVPTLDAARSGVSGADGSVLLRATGGTTVATFLDVEGRWTNASDLTLANGSIVTATGHLDNTGSLHLEPGAVLALQQLDVQGNHLPGTGLLNNSGTLTGAGTVDGSVVNSGTVRIGGTGAAIGTLAISGNFTQQASGVLEADIAGPLPGTQHDQLVVGGQATLGGMLRVTPQPSTVTSVPVRTSDSVQGQLLALALPGAYVPVAGDAFTLIDAAGGVAPGSSFASTDAPAEYLPLLRVRSAGTLAPMPVAAAPAPLPVFVPAAAIPTTAAAPLVDAIAAVLGDSVSRTLIAQAVSSQESVLGSFLTVLASEEAAQDEERDKKRPQGDIVTDTQCR